MAPTRIIYLIATNYILGFDESIKNETNHFVQADAAEASKTGPWKAWSRKSSGNRPQPQPTTRKSHFKSPCSFSGNRGFCVR